MVKRFFEGIKDDIKDTIAPPKKALIVVDESRETPEKALAVPTDPDGNPASTPPPVPEDHALKAVPVAPEEMDPPREEMEESDPGPAPREKPRAIRAIPVGENEVIQDGVEEP